MPCDEEGGWCVKIFISVFLSRDRGNVDIFVYNFVWLVQRGIKYKAEIQTQTKAGRQAGRQQAKRPTVKRKQHIWLLFFYIKYASVVMCAHHTPDSGFYFLIINIISCDEANRS